MCNYRKTFVIRRFGFFVTAIGGGVDALRSWMRENSAYSRSGYTVEIEESPFSGQVARAFKPEKEINDITEKYFPSTSR